MFLVTMGIVVLGFWVSVMSPAAKKRELERANKAKIQNEEYAARYAASNPSEIPTSSGFRLEQERVDNGCDTECHNNG